MTIFNFIRPTVGFTLGMVASKYLYNLSWATIYERIFFGFVGIACVLVSYELTARFNNRLINVSHKKDEHV